MYSDNISRYNDIIDLSYKASGFHRKMSLHDRAAQFSAFAALSGYEAAVKESGRLVEKRAVLADDELYRINFLLEQLRTQLDNDILVTVTYFIPDERKSGGRYVDKTGRVKRIDENKGLLVFTDNEEVPIGELYDIELFAEEYE